MCIRDSIYNARPALEIETAGFEVLGGLLELFYAASEAYASEQKPGTRERMLYELLPAQFRGHKGDNGNKMRETGRYERLLKVVDFVAGMTDSYAVDLYRKLKGIDLPT